MAQAPSFKVIELGPQGFGFPGYISTSTGISVGFGSLNNSNQVALNATSNMGVNPNPTGFDGPLGGGKHAAAIWDKGMLRDMRWSLPGSLINNPHFGSIHHTSNVSISSNGNLATQCVQSSFGDPGLPNFGPERCVVNHASMFHNSTRTWKLIGTLSDNTSQSPFVRQFRESASMGVNASGVAVGFSRRDPAQDPNDSQAYQRAFSFLDSNPSQLIASNLGVNLGVFPVLLGYNIQNQLIGPLGESQAMAINDNGQAVGVTRLFTVNGLHAAPALNGQPYCDPVLFPKAGQIRFVPNTFSTAANSAAFPAALGNICEVDGIVNAISTNGNMGGSYSHASWSNFPSARRPFIIVSGVRTDIPIPAGAVGDVNGINAIGDAVGMYVLPNNDRIPFLYRGGTLYNLRDLVPANPPGMTLSGRFELNAAMAINDSGAIAAFARFVFNETVPLFHSRSVLLVEQNFCNSQVSISEVPATLPQSGVDQGVTIRLQQASGGCNVTPVGEVRLIVNNQLRQTEPVLGGPQDPLGIVSKFTGFEVTQGLNAIRVEYSGNGLYAPASATLDVTAGPRCLAGIASPTIQRGALFRTNPGQPGTILYSQRLTITNNTGVEMPANTAILIRNLNPNVNFTNPNDYVRNCDALAPANTPLVYASFEPIPPGGRVQVTLNFSAPNAQTPVTYQTSVIAGPGRL
jgi:hypothetical protein